MVIGLGCAYIHGQRPKPVALGSCAPAAPLLPALRRHLAGHRQVPSEGT